MNFDLSDEQRLFVESASRYVSERADIEAKRKNAGSDEGFSHAHWRQFADMGWLALMLPEAADGLAAGIDDMAILMEQIGKGVFHEPIIDTPILCATLLARSDAAPALTSLSSIGTGDNIVALAQVERDARCELSTPINTTATASGDAWQLDGHKTRVFFGNHADQLIVSAKLNGELALFLVDAGANGINTLGYTMIDGSPAADISFNAVLASTLLLQGDAAEHALNLAIDTAIMADCARALGSMEAVMTMTADYLKTRVQYGKPLAQFQALQHRMSEMLVEYEQAQSIVYRALSLFNDDAQRPSAVSAAKVLVSKSGRWVTGQGIQLHGGIGVTDEYAIGHYYKALLTLEQRFGDSEIHLDRCDSIIG